MSKRLFYIYVFIILNKLVRISIPETLESKLFKNFPLCLMMSVCRVGQIGWNTKFLNSKNKMLWTSRYAMSKFSIQRFKLACWTSQKALNISLNLYTCCGTTGLPPGPSPILRIHPQHSISKPSIVKMTSLRP